MEHYKRRKIWSLSSRKSEASGEANREMVNSNTSKMQYVF